MVSQHFWPHLLGEDMRLHPAMQTRLEAFGKAYSVVKNPRLLVWKKQVRNPPSLPPAYSAVYADYGTTDCCVCREQIRRIIVSSTSK